MDSPLVVGTRTVQACNGKQQIDTETLGEALGTIWRQHQAGPPGDAQKPR